jgi:hypothetical protein
MKVYGGEEVKFHTLWNLVLDGGELQGNIIQRYPVGHPQIHSGTWGKGAGA